MYFCVFVLCVVYLCVKRERCFGFVSVDAVLMGSMSRVAFVLVRFWSNHRRDLKTKCRARVDARSPIGHVRSWAFVLFVFVGMPCVVYFDH